MLNECRVRTNFIAADHGRHFNLSSTVRVIVLRPLVHLLLVELLRGRLAIALGLAIALRPTVGRRRWCRSATRHALVVVAPIRLIPGPLGLRCAGAGADNRARSRADGGAAAAAECRAEASAEQRATHRAADGVVVGLRLRRVCILARILL